MYLKHIGLTWFFVYYVFVKLENFVALIFIHTIFRIKFFNDFHLYFYRISLPETGSIVNFSHKGIIFNDHGTLESVIYKFPFAFLLKFEAYYYQGGINIFLYFIRKVSL